MGGLFEKNIFAAFELRNKFQVRKLPNKRFPPRKTEKVKKPAKIEKRHLRIFLTSWFYSFEFTRPWMILRRRRRFKWKQRTRKNEKNWIMFENFSSSKAKIKFFECRAEASPGVVVMVENSRSRGCGFESQHWMYIVHSFFLKLYCLFRKRPGIAH